MNRRQFLQTAVLASSLPLTAGRALPGPQENTVMTVRGPLPVRALGLALTHEHVLVDFIEADRATPDRYDADEVFETVVPYLNRIKALGCTSFFEFTPAYLGRDPLLLRRLSEATGLHILTNTGYYGARNDQHVPGHAMEEEADALAARWVREFTDGIGSTGVRPGFIKIGVDSGPLSAIDAKLVRAGARTHRQTGLTVAVHTGPAQPAFEQLALLAEEGVHPSAWIWVHAQGEEDMARHAQAAERGAWVAFDGIGPGNLERDVALVRHMKAEGLLDRVLLSQDAGWYSVGEERGGSFRGYDYFFTTFLPELRKAAFSEEEIHQLTVVNPARAFAVRVRTPEALNVER